MKKIRTVVVGLGRIGWKYHIPEILAHDGFELVGVADPLAERVDEAKREYGAAGFLDYAEMIKEVKPDLVVIASPTKFHCEQVQVAFEAGADVFCEKPVVLSLDEMDKIVAAKEKYGRKFMAYQPHRSYCDIISLQHILSQGLLGRVYMIKRCCSAFVRRSDWQAFVSHGGGMLNNYGSHFIDQLMYLADSKIVDIKCIRRKIASLGDADDVVKILMETESGMVLDLDINMATAFEMTPWQVLGYNGTAVFDGKVWKVKYFAPDELEDVGIQKTLAAEGRSYSNGEQIPWKEAEFKADDFEPVHYYTKCYDYFGKGEEPFVDISQSRELLDIIERCRAASVVR